MTKEQVTLRTPKVVLSYPELFVPKPNEDKVLYYSATFVFDAEAQATSEFKALKVAASQAALTKWKEEEIRAMMAAGLFKTPFLSGDSPRYSGKYPELAGKVFIRTKSKMKPGVVDRQRLPITDESKIYPGCYVFATLNCYPYDQKGNQGVGFGLRNVQFVADGTPLGGRTRPEDDFEALDADAFVESKGGAAGGTEAMF